MFCQRKNKSHHHPTKGKRKCDVFVKGKTKTMTTQQKGKGNVMFLPKEKQKPCPPNKREKEVGFCF
jgi:hypothetical protein